MGIKNSLKTVWGVIDKNSPHILTGLGCAGLVTTAVLSGMAVPKAMDILVDHPEADGLVDKAKITWKVFVPATLTGAASIACIIGANSINTKRNAAIAALYSITDTAFKEYRKKVIEEIGKSKEKKIRDQVYEDRIQKNPEGEKSQIVIGNGDVLCYDILSDRYFPSDYEKIRRAVNDINFELMDEMWIPLNDFYYRVGLASTKLGEQVGFSIDKGKLDPTYSTQLSKDGKPCLVIDMEVYPRY